MFVFLFFVSLLTLTGSHPESSHFFKFNLNPRLKGTFQKCSKLYSNSMIKYVRQNHSSNEILYNDLINKLTNATGESATIVTKCLGISNN
jgi:hypothetical protein